MMEIRGGLICSKPLKILGPPGIMEKNSSDHIQEKLNPYEENPITERNGDMSKLDLFFP